MTLTLERPRTQTHGGVLAKKKSEPPQRTPKNTVVSVADIQEQIEVIGRQLASAQGAVKRLRKADIEEIEIHGFGLLERASDSLGRFIGHLSRSMTNLGEMPY